MTKAEYIKEIEDILGDTIYDGLLMSNGDVEESFNNQKAIIEALYQLHIEGVREIIEDLEFRLIDNRIPEWDEKYKLMKMDVSRVKNNFGITE